MADVADRLGPAPREEALDVVPVGLGQDSTGNIKPQFSILFSGRSGGGRSRNHFSVVVVVGLLST